MESTNDSSDTLTCTQCGRIFNTVEDLDEHQKSEQQDLEERNKGIQIESKLMLFYNSQLTNIIIYIFYLNVIHNKFCIN